MKVLQICSYYKGTSLYQQLFEQLEEVGVSSDVFYFTSRGVSVENLPDHVVVSRAYRSWERMIFWLKHGKVYADATVSLPLTTYNLTHAHSLMSNGVISLKLKIAFGLPFVVAVRSTDLFTFFKWKPHLIPLGRKILNAADKVVFLSQPYMDHTLARVALKNDRTSLARKSIVIPNGIDSGFLTAGATPLVRTDTIQVVQVAREVDDPRKNVKTTLAACDLLVRLGYPVELLLIGELGQSAIASEIAMRPYVRAVGRVDQNELRSQLRRSAIFVMPSVRETFGLVYAEAMSQGLPVIYTKGQGFDQHFSDGEVGYAVEPFDVTGIASRILSIWGTYETFSERALAGALKFDWNAIANRYKALYGGMVVA